MQKFSFPQNQNMVRADVFMPGVGLEPTSPCGRDILRVLRLPISPPGRLIRRRPGRELHPRIALLQSAALATWLPGRVKHHLLYQI